MPRATLAFVLAALSLAPAALHTQTTTQTATQTAPEPAWQTALAARRAELIASNGPGTDPQLRSELLTLRNDDQAARGIRGNGQPATAVASNLHEIDTDLTARLKTIVAQHGWPTIALVGIDASDAAMLLLNHSTDPAWRASLLPQLEALADQRKIDGAALALVVDKQLIASGKPQRYGTQFKFVDGEMAMYEVEDPGGLDSLRARTLLPPIEVYKAQLARLYHLKTNNRIVSPPAPVAATPAP